MNLNNIDLIISAGRPDQFPELEVPSIVFCGRSNAGKSSMINKLISRKSLARTSGAPGKTATVNFYNIDQKLCFVDLPGYGYAAVEHGKKDGWVKLIDSYFQESSNIAFALFIVDIRHKPARLDLSMMNYLQDFEIPFIVICNKADKLKDTEIPLKIQMIKKEMVQNSLLPQTTFIPFSAESGLGVEEIWDYINRTCFEGV